MSIVRWKPFDEMEKFLNQTWGDLTPRAGFDLAADVYEDGSNVIAEMAIPGIDPNRIEVFIEDDVLRVTGSREDKQEKKDKNYYSKEIRRGSFERVLSLPRSVLNDKTIANYSDGVLKVTMPAKNGGKAPFKVKIQPGK